MNDAPDQDDQVDENGETEEESEESPLFKPPGDDDYDTIRYSSELKKLPAGFDAFSRRILTQPGSAFASRFAPADGRKRGLDLELFEELVGRVARLNRWVANSVTDGPAGNPRVLAALPGSLTVHFGLSEGERLLRLGGERAYPSIYGARATGRLMAYGADSDRLLPAVHPLGKRAVQMLLSAFEDATNDDLTIGWLTREGQYTELTPERAEEGIKILNIVPPMRSKTSTVVAYLDEPSDDAKTVRLTPLQGRPFVARYPQSLEEAVRMAWAHYVRCRIRTEAPENPSLPRAPRRKHFLRRIERVYDALPVDA